MDYEKKYKEALDAARYWHNESEGDIPVVLEEIFPELKESKDEMIRKKLISYFSAIKGFSTLEYNYGISNEDAVAWLEKQGEQSYKIIKGKNYFCVKTHNYAGVEWVKGTKYYASDNYTLVNQGCGYYCPEYSKEEHNNLFEEVKCDGCVGKQNEQKPVDKIKSKFKVGDSIKTTDEEPLTITKIDDKGYWSEDLFICGFDDTSKWELVERKSADKVEPKFHEGEWLVNVEYGNVVRVLKVLEDNYRLDFGGDTIGTLCAELVDSDYRLWNIIQDAKDGDVLAAHECLVLFKEIDGLNIRCYCTYHYLNCQAFYVDTLQNKTPFHPATKEQRETLFARMKKAGYEWNAEKKELKKIEDEEYNGEDYGIDSLYHAQRILEKTLGSVDGYQTDDGILSHKCAISAVKKLCEQKLAEWSEEDERIRQCLIRDQEEALDDVRNDKYGHSEIISDLKEMYRERIDWLKSLKDRVQPKQKWKQENTGDLTDFENAMMHIGGSFFGQYAGLDPNDTNVIKEQANLLLELVPSKEWGEEDEKILSGLISRLVRIGANTRTDSTSINYTFPREIDWLKSIKERVQPKQEWSEEDKDYYDAIIAKLEVMQEDAALTDNQMNFLKSLKPRKQWKPSDEQMEYLYKYTEQNNYDGAILTSLYNDLKQL